jgi:hypothetical protein
VEPLKPWMPVVLDFVHEVERNCSGDTAIARDQKVIEWGYQRSLGITTRNL